MSSENKLAAWCIGIILLFVILLAFRDAAETDGNYQQQYNPHVKYE